MLHDARAGRREALVRRSCAAARRIEALARLLERASIV
jgi:hypothetical protein